MADIDTTGVATGVSGMTEEITKFALAAGYPIVYGIILVFIMYLAYTWLIAYADK